MAHTVRLCVVAGGCSELCWDAVLVEKEYRAPPPVEKRPHKNAAKNAARYDDKELCGVISTRGVACKQV